jgi:hypothetical protein
MPIHLSRPLGGALLCAAVLFMSTFTASAGASVPVDLRVVDSDGAILADHTQYTDAVSLRTDPEADCFGDGTGGSGDRVRVPGRTALGAVVDGQIADGDLKPVSVTDAFDFGIGLCGIGGAVAPQSGFWYLKRDQAATTTGGDLTKVKRFDEIVWYLDPDFADAPPAELQLVQPSRVEFGEPFQVTVFEYSDDGTRSPAAGVDVTGADQPTGADGTTQATIPEGDTDTGELRATRSGAISDSARICAGAQLNDCPRRPGELIGGSSKDDEIDGGKGPDAIHSGDGADRIDVRDGGPDEVNCGRGKDKVKADREDATARNCEKVRD